MKVKIDIETITFVKFWLVIIGLGLVAYAIYSAMTALMIIGAAVFLAVALSSWVNRLAKIFPSKSRVLGTALAYVAVISILGLIIFLIIPPVIEQSAKFAQTVPNLIDSASEQYKGVDDFIQRYNLEAEYSKVIDSVKTSAADYASNIGPKLIKSISSLFVALASTILVLVLAFLMLIEAPIWLGILWSTYKDKTKMNRHRDVLKKMYAIITGYVTGQLTVSAIAGAFSGILVLILCLIFDVPVNISIPASAIVFISSLIPMFGSTIGAIIISAILILHSVPATLIFLIIFVIYQQIEGNYVVPKIQSNKINLSALAVLISITIGIYVFGIVGGIISIPIAGCIKVIVEEFSNDEKDDKPTKKTKLF